MLRFERRWHDAANVPPIDGEGRLLWFAKKRNAPAGGTNPDDEDEETQEEATDAAEGQARGRQIDVEQEYNRREAQRVLSEGEVSDTIPSTTDVVSGIKTLDETLAGLDESLTKIESERKNSQASILRKQRGTINVLRRRAQDHAYTLNTLKLDEWESGKITPKEFLKRYEAYIDQMKSIDEMDASKTPEERAERDESRRVLLEEVKTAVEEVRTKHPPQMPTVALQGKVEGLTDEEIWDLYTTKEKEGITNELSKVAGLDFLKITIQDDVDTIREVLEDKNIAQEIMKMERELYQDAGENFGPEKTAEELASEEIPRYTDAFSTVMSGWTKLNEAAGIEWMTAYEWYGAFKEVYESIVELRKKKSQLRISRAATQIGHVAALIPGLGGKDLEHIIDEQLQNKNDEEKDKFVKELKNNKIDLGFRQLFGEPGQAGLLQHYAMIGDTNRTRAILEFAAGKGMLYGLEGTDWTSYQLPGGLSVSEVLPSEWPDDQKSTYWDNVVFMNSGGIAAQTKAGEDFTSGRPSLKEYLGPFKGAVHNMSLWFAKGIANKALTKVKEGQASAMLTLIVLEEWENNPLFRKYVPAEWLDRLAGDSKQLMVGMLKYDQGQLLAGARGGEDYETHDISQMKSKPRSPGEQPGEGRLGPLVAAVRRVLIKNDPSVKPGNDDESKDRFRELTAKVLACQIVKLPNGKEVSLYMPELEPFQIAYKPNEMRDANVSALGDDFFIEQSEITNCTAEVMQYIGRVTQEGFAEPTKARYFFSHIITTYDNLNARARKPGPQKEEFQEALVNFVAKQRGNLDQWIERALQGNGGTKLLTEKHADQRGRRLVLTMLKYGLISLSVIERVANLQGASGNAARQLLKHYEGIGNTEGSTRHAGRRQRLFDELKIWETQ